MCYQSLGKSILNAVNHQKNVKNKTNDKCVLRLGGGVKNLRISSPAAEQRLVQSVGSWMKISTALSSTKLLLGLRNQNPWQMPKGPVFCSLPYVTCQSNQRFLYYPHLKSSPDVYQLPSNSSQCNQVINKHIVTFSDASVY